MAAKFAVALDVIDVARPCPTSWDAMLGTDSVRFCRHCSLHVYNLSAMTRDEGRALLDDRDGRLCVRFHRRLDGTLVTDDCRGGWRLAARRARRFSTAAAGMVLTAALTPVGLFDGRANAAAQLLAGPMRTLTRWATAMVPTGVPTGAIIPVAPHAGAAPAPAIMGDIAAPVPPATQPAPGPDGELAAANEDEACRLPVADEPTPAPAKIGKPLMPTSRPGELLLPPLMGTPLPPPPASRPAE